MEEIKLILEGYNVEKQMCLRTILSATDSYSSTVERIKNAQKRIDEIDKKVVEIQEKMFIETNNPPTV